MFQNMLFRLAVMGLPFLFLLIPLGQAQARAAGRPVWVAFSESDAPQSASVWVDSSSAEGLDFWVDLPGVWGEAVEGENTTRLWLEGDSGRERSGPDLPVMRWVVEVPNEASISVEIESVEQRPLPLQQWGLPDKLAEIRPEECKCEQKISAPEAQPDGGERQVVQLVDDYIQRGKRSVVVEIRPVGMGINGELTLRGAVHVRLLFDYRDRPVSAHAQRMAGAQHGYLIIAPDAYVDALEPFASLKQSEGYEVTIARLSQVGNTTEAIRKFIFDSYMTWGAAAPAYLLLVGDTGNGEDSVPSWQGLVAPGYTDLYYATLDGDDWVPDLKIGRLPARSVQEVSAYVQRAQDFSRRHSSADWLRQASFIGTCDYEYYEMVEATHSAVIDQFTRPGGYFGSYPVNPQAGGDRLYCVGSGASYTNIQKALSSGRAWITYSGHGSATSWEMGIHNIAVSELASSTATPVVLSFACKTADFNVERSFGEVWMLDGGALAFVGSTADTYWRPDDQLQRAIYQAMFDSTTKTLGEALQDGLSAVNRNLPGYSHLYYEAYHVFGDPSLAPLSVPQAGLEVQSVSSTTLALPGRTALIQFNVTNRTQNDDSLQIIVSDAQWPVQVSAPAVIRPQETVRVSVAVQIPEGAGAGERNDIGISVTSRNDPNNSSLMAAAVQATDVGVWLPYIGN